MSEKELQDLGGEGSAEFRTMRAGEKNELKVRYFVLFVFAVLYSNKS